MLADPLQNIDQVGVRVDALKLDGDQQAPGSRPLAERPARSTQIISCAAGWNRGNVDPRSHSHLKCEQLRCRSRLILKTLSHSLPYQLMRQLLGVPDFHQAVA